MIPLTCKHLEAALVFKRRQVLNLSSCLALSPSSSVFPLWRSRKILNEDCVWAAAEYNCQSCFTGPNMVVFTQKFWTIFKWESICNCKLSDFRFTGTLKYPYSILIWFSSVNSTVVHWTVDVCWGNSGRNYKPRRTAECSPYTRETWHELQKLSQHVICDEYWNHLCVYMPHFHNVRESGEFTRVILENCHRVWRTVRVARDLLCLILQSISVSLALPLFRECWHSYHICKYYFNWYSGCFRINELACAGMGGRTSLFKLLCSLYCSSPQKSY